ncbi:MAG: hypothetical protein WD940_00555 [Patescibacteria group bacterium]
MKRFLTPFLVLALAVAGATIVYATHSWGGYHWARTANPFTLKLGDNVSTAWDSYLATTSGDWSVASVLDTAVVSGSTNPRNCKAVTGRVEVCSSKYGYNGWLGVATIWVSGGHITKGTTKLNDSYFNTATYNTPGWRNLVMCQEVGHTIGLDHQDETFENQNLGTCMDYTNDPNGTLYAQLSNEHPNLHDYEMLETIYEHLDTTTTIKQTTSKGRPEIDLSNPEAWGRELRRSSDGRQSLYERDLGRGDKIFTFVIWAKE